MSLAKGSIRVLHTPKVNHKHSVSMETIPPIVNNTIIIAHHLQLFLKTRTGKKTRKLVPGNWVQHHKPKSGDFGSAVTKIQPDANDGCGYQPGDFFPSYDLNLDGQNCLVSTLNDLFKSRFQRLAFNRLNNRFDCIKC